MPQKTQNLGFAGFFCMSSTSIFIKETVESKKSKVYFFRAVSTDTIEMIRPLISA